MKTIRERRDQLWAEIDRARESYQKLKSQAPVATQHLLQRLEEHYNARGDEDSSAVERSLRWQKRVGLKRWEVFFCPEQGNYEFVLSHVKSENVIFDACAGDLRLDLLLSDICKRVYAVEINARILGPSIELIGYDMPRNLFPICANVLLVPLPKDVTTIVLLHRHFVHTFPKEWRSKTIITNADYQPLNVRAGRGKETVTREEEK